jgi:hypothetical protein
MGELLQEIYATLVDNKRAVDAAKAAKDAADAKAKVDGEAAALTAKLEAGKLEIATKAAALAKAEHDERVAEVEALKARLRAEEQAIVLDRARRGKKALSAVELRVRATKSIRQQERSEKP